MATVQKWGNSLAVRIPRSLAGQIDVKDVTPVEMCVRDGELIVRPERRHKLSLSKLLTDCRPCQLHGETECGVDVGRESVD